MSPAIADWIGYAAATCTTLAFVPQALLTIRTRDVSGVSLTMYATFTFGVALWLAYGIATRQWPLIVANTATLALAATILGVKIAVGRQRRGATRTAR